MVPIIVLSYLVMADIVKYLSQETEDTNTEITN